MKTVNKIEIIHPPLKPEDRSAAIMEAMNKLEAKHKTNPIEKITLIYERGTIAVREMEEVE